jgi:hypothetical protein
MHLPHTIKHRVQKPPYVRLTNTSHIVFGVKCGYEPFNSGGQIFLPYQVQMRFNNSSHAISIDGRNASNDGRVYLCPVIDSGV